MATLADVYTEAQAHLADVAKEVWTDAVLLPFVNRAYRVCSRILRAEGMGLFRKETAADGTTSAIVLDPGGSTIIRYGATAVEVLPVVQAYFPADMIRPLEIRERDVSNDVPPSYASWSTLRSSEGFLPDAPTASEKFAVWDWRADRILLRSGYYKSTHTHFQILYEAELTALSTGTDLIGIPDGLDAVSLMTAAFAARSRDEKTTADSFYQAAVEDLKLISASEARVKNAAAARWGTQ